MRIAACVSDRETRETLLKWLEQYCGLYEIDPEITGFRTAGEFFAARRLRAYDVVFVGISGPDGFNCARRMREEDQSCRMVGISDTKEYAMEGLRLHFSDYMLMPIEFKSFVRAMKLAGVGQ